MINLSQKRVWGNDIYFVYDLTSKDRGKYLNTWFQGRKNYSKRSRKSELKADVLMYDSLITLKRVDNETSNMLYNRKYNPIMMTIKYESGTKEIIYKMKITLCSIDDSSFGIWYTNKSFSELSDIREKLMEWVSEQAIGKAKGLNGEELLNICIENGADKNTIDYN